MATQAERTAATRLRLLEAAVSVLIERGLSGASLPVICRTAGVSRGAQLHHFPTRASLLAAAVEHLFDVRHAELREQLTRRPAGSPREVLGRLFAIYTSGPLFAWLELVVAARTDPELRAHVTEVDARFEVRAAETLATVFDLPAGLDVRAAVRLITSLLDGLSTHHILATDDRSASAVLDLAAALLAPALGTR